MDLALARVVHVLAVVLWIGGVAMVTLVLLPAVRGFESAERRVAFFEQIEARFGAQARVTTVITAASGFYLLHAFGWERLALARYWWIHAMIGVWLLFTLMLFVVEPLFLRKRLARADRAPGSTFRRLQRMHYVMLGVSLLTVAGAVAGSHGWFWF